MHFNDTLRAVTDEGPAPNNTRHAKTNCVLVGTLTAQHVRASGLERNDVDVKFSCTIDNIDPPVTVSPVNTGDCQHDNSITSLLEADDIDKISSKNILAPFAPIY